MVTDPSFAPCIWSDKGVGSNYDDIDKVNVQSVRDYIDGIAAYGTVGNWDKRFALYDKIDARRVHEWKMATNQQCDLSQYTQYRVTTTAGTPASCTITASCESECATYDADIREYGVSIGPWEPEGFVEENLAPYEIEARKAKRDPKVVQRELVDLRRSIRHMTRDPEPVGTTHEGVMNPEALKMTHYWGAMFTGGWNG